MCGALLLGPRLVGPPAESAVEPGVEPAVEPSVDRGAEDGDPGRQWDEQDGREQGTTQVEIALVPAHDTGIRFGFDHGRVAIGVSPGNPGGAAPVWFGPGRQPGFGPGECVQAGGVPGRVGGSIPGERAPGA